MRIFTVLFFAFVMLTAAAPAKADAWVPGSPLQMKIVSREGEAFVVEVANQSDAVVPFDARGLYFVPESEEPPQRLGVVTPGEVAIDDHWFPAASTIDIAPHKVTRVKLNAFCLDHQRPSPTDKTKYVLARNRMPPALLAALVQAADSAANPQVPPPAVLNQETAQSFVANGRATMPLSMRTQQAVWQVREAMPVSLFGETPQARPGRAIH